MKSRSSGTFLVLGVAGGLVALGCGGASSVASHDTAPPAASGTSQAQVSRVTGYVVAATGVTGLPAQSPVPGVQVTVASTGRNAATDNQGYFAVDTPAGLNQLLFNQGSRGSVDVTVNQGMQLNVSVAVSAQSATVLCQAQQPMGTSNAEHPCAPKPTSGTPGGNGPSGNTGTPGQGGNGTPGQGGNGGNGNGNPGSGSGGNGSSGNQ
jgi:hypothetical protein